MKQSLYQILKTNIFKTLLLGIIPSLSIIIFILSIYKQELTIIPTSNHKLDIQLNTKLFTDTSTQGNSKIFFLSNDKSGYTFKYILGEAYLHAFVGVSFETAENQFLNLEGYDDLSIKLSSKKGSRIPVTFSEFVPKFKDKSKSFKYRNHQYIFNVNNNITETKVSLTDFKTPDWWFSLNNTKEADYEAIDYSKIKNIIIGNCYNLPKNVEDEINIESIKVSVNYTFRLLIFSSFIIIYYLLIWLFIYKKRKTVTPEINIQYNKIEAINYADKEEELIFSFITENYRNQEFSIIDIQQETGIYERKISGIIKTKTNLNFKQLLNKIRITEAKRLLTETDLQISEIADLVGYGNTTHFNRVFKITENCSPNDFRKANSKIN